MTFRELIRTCGHSPMFDLLRQFYYPDESTDNLLEYSLRYRKVGLELISLPQSPNSLFKIYITGGETDGESFIDVCLLNKEDDELFSMDMVKWEDLIDMEVYRAVDLNNNQTLAHILWEVTFWGWNSDQILDERRKLLDLIKDPHATEWTGWEDSVK